MAIQKQKKAGRARGEDLSIVDGRAGEDSIRVWDRYKERAHFWRAIALLQIPLAIIALIAMISMYFSGDTIVQVPDRPQPGSYSMKKLPDSEFINVAVEVANLVTTFTPATADRQFKAARKFLWEPALSQFETDKIQVELRMIQETSRSQLFFIDTKQIKVERLPEIDSVVVRLPGVRQKLIGNQAIPPDQLVAYVRMTTIPRNEMNEFGIVVTDMRFNESGMPSVVPSTNTPAAPAKAKEEVTGAVQQELAVPAQAPVEQVPAAPAVAAGNP